jgi:hypothetical protein
MTGWNDLVVQTFSNVSSNIIHINTSGTQFPNVDADRHIIKAFQSGIVYVAGVNTVTSGTGFMLAGGPNDLGATLQLGKGNLNVLYGSAAISSILMHISYS